MHLIDLSNFLWFGDLNETTDTSIPKILNWLIANIGLLNESLGKSYEISGNDANPELGNDESAIFGLIYLDRYYSRQIQNNLGASAYTEVLEVQEGDSKVRLQNRNELSKVFLQLKTQNRENLDKYIQAYLRFRCIPASIHSNIGAFSLILQQH